MHACRYAILRFQPYIETGEFANIGVVLLSTTGRFFGFKLLEKRFARVNHFFALKQSKLLKNALADMREELERIRMHVSRLGLDRRFKAVDEAAVDAFFNELTRKREGILHFDAQRLMVADDLKAALAELYVQYVAPDQERNIDLEPDLERSVAGLLRNAELAGFYKEHAIGEGLVLARFPFVRVGDSALRAIKPLRLTGDDEAKAYDTGLTWSAKVAELRKRNLLQGEILFVLQGRADGAHADVTHEVAKKLREVGTEVLDVAEDAKIIEFARKAA